MPDSLGGPARRTSRQFNPTRIAGGPALRVYRVASGSRPVEGGPALPVYYVEDSELRQNGGKFSLQGNRPVPIFEAGNVIVEGRPALPVYATNGVGAILEMDAIAYWRLEEASGTRADATGNGHDLTAVNNPASAAGKIGNAVEFTNPTPGPSSPYLKRAHHADLVGGVTRTFTFSAWVFLPSGVLTSALHIVFEKGQDISVEYGLGFGQRGSSPQGSFFFYMTDYVSIGDQVATDVVTTNAWHFLTCGYDLSQDKIFIRRDDQAQTSASTAEAAPVDPDAPFLVGLSYEPDPSAASAVTIDEVGRWNRLLTTAERDYLYNGGAGRALFA